MGHPQYVVDISRVDKTELEYFGTKAFELGELKHLGIPIPEGFIITPSFFEEFLKLTGISKDLEKVRKIYHPSLAESIEILMQPIGKIIMQTHIPPELASELHKFYRKLAGQFGEAPVNIFSSSRSNKFITFSNVQGDANLVLKIKSIWASYINNPVAIIISKKIEKSDFTGKISTNNPIFDKNLTEELKNKLNDCCKIIQKHFYFPKQVEYVISNEKISIIDMKPFTGTIAPIKHFPKNTNLRKILARGIPLNPGIATGPVKVLDSKRLNSKVGKGEVIVLSNLNSLRLKEIRHVKAIVIDGTVSSALSRALYRKDLRIPTIEGVTNAIHMLRDGNIITVNGITGEIYSGGLR